MGECKRRLPADRCRPAYYGSGASSLVGKPGPRILDFLVAASTLAYQVLYGTFLAFTWCFDSHVHSQAITYMNMANVVHWVLVLCAVGCATAAAKRTSLVILTNLAIGIFAFVMMNKYKDGEPNPHLFFYFECLGLSCTFALPLVLM